MIPDVLPAARRCDLASELAFFFAELRRHDDLDGAVQIAVTAARTRHSLAGEANSAPVLRLRRDPQGHSPLERGHGNFPAEHRFVHRDWQIDAKIVAIAREERMWLHANPEVCVASSPTVRTGSALSCATDALAVFDPRRDLPRQPSPAFMC